MALVELVCEEQHYQTGSDRSVQAHINDVAWHLKDMTNDIGFLPESPQDGFGVKMNEWLRQTKEDKDYFTPIEVFRDFWLGMLNEIELQKTETAEIEPATTLPDNVVPFRRR